MIVKTMQSSTMAAGALDGLTVLRYGHMYDTRGGMEQYLSDLNGVLADRNRFTTVQVQMTSDPARVGIREKQSGVAPIVECSLFVDRSSHEQAISSEKERPGLGRRCKAWLRDHVAFSPPVYRAVTRSVLRHRRHPRRPGEPTDAGKTVRELDGRWPLDLICLHSIGGADSAEILDYAEEKGIPVAYIHHFSNDRLAGFSVSAQLERVDAVAGVCAIDVPAYLAGRFVNLSDGIDTEFFRRENARPLAQSFADPVIFLPARYTPTKGQEDLIRAVGHLNKRGLSCRLALAGRTESAAYLDGLKQLARTEGIWERVSFLDALGAEELRDWYAAAAVVAFPTYHHEGLGRISVEAQSMMTPPVVYGIGGTPEGLRDGETGLLVPLGDEAALCSSLERLLRDEPLRRRMGAAGRAFAEQRFSLAALAERHEQFLLRASQIHGELAK